MHLGAISLVLRKAELGKLLVEFPHDPVAGDLGDDAGRSNRERQSVAFHDSVVGDGKIFDRQSVDQAVVR